MSYISPSSMTRKEKRVNSKKRKAEAFLALVSQEADDDKSFDQVKKEIDNGSDSEGTVPSKIQKPSEKSQEPLSTKEEAFKKAQDSLNRLKEANKTSAQKAEEDLARLRQMIRDRQKSSMEKPKMYLTLDELAYQNGRMLSQNEVVPELPPLFILDLQHLALFGLQGNLCSYKPRWCRLLRPGKVAGVVVLVMEDVSTTELHKYPDSFQNIKSEFEMQSIEMVSPAQYGSTVAEDLFHVPLSMKQMKALNVEKAKRMKFKVLTKPPDFIIVNQKEQPVSNFKEDNFQRTCLLLNTTQMLQEGYPMPVRSSENTYKNFKYTNEKYSTVTSQSPMFGLDCEMCMTTTKRLELTRVSVINENLETVYDTLVKPYNKITNYLTRWSGITKALLDPVTKRLEEVQTDLQNLLPPDAILCGQSLQSDLLALQMFHPYVIDTSVIYNLSGQQGIKPGLKTLTQRFLGQTIQENEEGHCPVEDARATLKLVQHKLKHSVDYGDVRLSTVIFPQFDADGNVIKPAHNENASNSDISASDSAVSTSDSVNKVSTVTSEREDNYSDKTLTGIKYFLNNRDRTVAQRRTFFHREGEFVYQDFFKLVRNQKKTAALVAGKEVVDYFGKNDIASMESDCDKTTKSLTKSYVQYHDFVYSSFPSFKQCSREEMTEHDKQKLLWKMSRKIGKVLKHVRPNSIVMVVLPGRTDNEGDHNATCLCKMT